MKTISFVAVEKITPKEARKIRLILLGFTVFGLITLRYNPLQLLHRLTPGIFNTESSCPMLNITGIPCPFCGMTRGFSEFIQFNFSKSIYYNPSSVVFFTFLGTACLSILILSFFNFKISVTFNRKTFLISSLVLIIIWILNILYGHPF